MTMTDDRGSALLSEAGVHEDHESAIPTGMQVKKRNGALEPVDLNKIVNAVARCAEGLLNVDAMRVATRTISALADGATTRELDELSIRTAAGFTVAAFVEENAPALNAAINTDRDRKFEFFGLRTVYDRYLLRHPETRQVTETPQYFFLRVACGLSQNADEAIRFYDLMSSLAYLPSSPTLFNSGTRHAQMSSCYLLDSPDDSLEGIYKRYTDIARLSKFAGGIGVAWSRIRSKGSLIQGTNGLSNGIVPWLKTLDSSVAAVNQGGRRKGAACIYLESWHADIEEFLDLKENTGDHMRRAHSLNLANWIPDLFMERVDKDWQWSLFDPSKVPHLTDLFGDEFRAAYEEAEAAGLYERQINVRDLYSRMMRSLAQTGNGWMTFKDASNEKCNQTGMASNDGTANVVHLSNLCTEIIEVTNQDETAVCNLGSLNLGEFVDAETLEFDFDRLAKTVLHVMPFLDRVIDINFYPTDEAGHSNNKWRPVGLGLMGLQDVFFKKGLVFDSPEARALSARISEEIYLNALTASAGLAEEFGTHETYDRTRAAQGDLQFDLWGVEPTQTERWAEVRELVAKHGLRNSLMIAIAPTATIASISGCYECIEPQVSNLFKRETLSGEFLQINRYLVKELQSRGLWDAEMINDLKQSEGSVQGIARIPEDLKEIFRTAWEIPMRSLIDMAADRGAYIDQSQSLNLFMESPNIGKLSSMYMYAWKSGLKTTYYLRSRPATRINKTTTTTNGSGPAPTNGGEPKAFTEAEALACLLRDVPRCHQEHLDGRRDRLLR